jgi:hypothetical protein
MKRAIEPQVGGGCRFPTLRGKGYGHWFGRILAVSEDKRFIKVLGCHQAGKSRWLLATDVDNVWAAPEEMER